MKFNKDMSENKKFKLDLTKKNLKLNEYETSALQMDRLFTHLTEPNLDISLLEVFLNQSIIFIKSMLERYLPISDISNIVMEYDSFSPFSSVKHIYTKNKHNWSINLISHIECEGYVIDAEGVIDANAQITGAAKTNLITLTPDGASRYKFKYLNDPNPHYCFITIFNKTFILYSNSLCSNKYYIMNNLIEKDNDFDDSDKDDICTDSDIYNIFYGNYNTIAI